MIAFLSDEPTESKPMNPAQETKAPQTPEESAVWRCAYRLAWRIEFNRLEIPKRRHFLTMDRVTVKAHESADAALEKMRGGG